MTLTRKCAAASVFVLLLAGQVKAQGDRAQSDWHRQAVERPRRIIFNNDGGEPAVEMKESTAKAFLDCRTTRLADTQVDSIFYCTRTSGFGVFTHFTKVGQVFTCTEGRYAGNQMAALLRAGLDPLAMQVDFGHKHKKEVFWSLRMNDTHDGSKTDYGPIMFRDNKLKNEHPEYLLGSIKKPLKHGAWSAVNYARPEVRDLAFRYVEEVCRNYDIDGVELDFFRHPVFFPSTARGALATPDECDQMTGLLQRIRTMAHDVGKTRGRPILIAVKMPDSVEYGRAIGLDLETWLKQGLLDLYIPGGYFQLNDWEYSVALAKKYGVKVYPSLDESRLRDKAANAARVAAAGYRGRASAAWAAGADGIYLFNYFESTAELLKEIGDPQRLTQLDRDYFGSPRGVGNAAGGNYPYARFQKLETLNPANPKTLIMDKSATSRVMLGPMKKSTPVDVKLRVQIKNAPNANVLRVTMNDRPVTLTAAGEDWFEGPVDPATVRVGGNHVTINLSAAPPKAAKWTDLVVQVRVSRK